MQKPMFTIALVLGFGLLATVAVSQKGGEDETGPYNLVAGWPLKFAKDGYMQGSQGGVFAENPNRIFMANRGEVKIPDPPPRDFNGAWGSTGTPATQAKPELRNCIIIVDSNGKLLESWTQHDHLFQGGRGPHKIKISPYDPKHNVWVVDDMRHQVFKFSNDGKQLLMTLGEAGKPGNDESHFARPTDIAFLPDGSFFISDGYINTRVVKFNEDGKFMMTWGTPGKGPGQFDLPHSIDTDRNRRVYVADRSNSRIQIFDERGKYIDEWPNIRSPYHIMISADQHLWVSDGITNKLLEYNLEGKLLSSWGTYGTFPGSFWGVHQFSADFEGNLFMAETFGGRTQKFTPKPGAGPAHILKPPALALVD